MTQSEGLAKLAEIGFVHVTGLPQRCHGGEYKFIQAKRADCGYWDRAAAVGANRARILCITPEGEVWILGGDLDVVPTDALFAVCPNGRKPKMDSWPTFNWLNADDVLQRIRDPLWNLNGELSPVPQPVD